MKPLQVTCPQCGSKPRKPCVNTKGDPVYRHDARKEAAK